MLFSRSSYAPGMHTGFFYDDDAAAPSDCINVADADARTAINAPSGSTYDFDAQGVLTINPPAQQSLDAVKLMQVNLINASCNVALSKLVATYPPMEMQTWPNQYAEAVAYTSNNGAAVPTLSAIATASGLAVADVAAKVLAKANAYTSNSGSLIGKRQALTAQITSITAASSSQADIDAAVAAVRAVVW